MCWVINDRVAQGCLKRTTNHNVRISHLKCHSKTIHKLWIQQVGSGISVPETLLAAGLEPVLNLRNYVVAVDARTGLGSN